MSNRDQGLLLINEQILTTLEFKINNNQLDFLLLKRNFYFFCYADYTQNEFYNHLAFDQLQFLISQFTHIQGTRPIKTTNYILAVLLLKYKEWKYINLDLTRVFSKLDAAFENYFNSKSESFEDLIYLSLYLIEKEKSTITTSLPPKQLNLITEKTIQKLTNLILTHPYPNEKLFAQFISFINYVELTTELMLTDGLKKKIDSTKKKLSEKSISIRKHEEISKINSLYKEIEFITAQPNIKIDVSFLLKILDNLNAMEITDIGLQILFKKNTGLTNQHLFIQILK